MKVYVESKLIEKEGERMVFKNSAYLAGRGVLIYRKGYKPNFISSVRFKADNSVKSKPAEENGAEIFEVDLNDSYFRQKRPRLDWIAEDLEATLEKMLIEG